MRFEQLWEIILSDLKPKLEQNQGLGIFASERAKFEGWLKVELCASLSKFVDDVVPERDRIDVTFRDWAIELKTINTNYRFENVKNKTRPITKNIEGVINDIEKLSGSIYLNKAVLFVVFPLKHNDVFWKIHLEKIEQKLKILKHSSFMFNNEILGDIYLGLL